jgi:hypothetical protein
VFFYELHEGDDDVYSDVLVVSESEWEPQEFYELVQRVRRDVQDSYRHDTLIEAIAEVLERDHGFIYIGDERLEAAVNVSVVEAENFIVEVARFAGDDDDDDGDDDDDDDDEEKELKGDFRTLVTDVEFDLDAESRLN